MPKEKSVYTRNKDFIDQLRADGNTWREIGKELARIGVNVRFQSVHKAYLNYHRKQVDKQLNLPPPPAGKPSLERFVKIQHPDVWKSWTKHNKARQKQVDKTSFAETLRNLTSASVQTGEIELGDSETVQDRCEMLAKYSQALASIYLYHCMVLPKDRWLTDFDNLLKVVGEITERMQSMID